MNNKRFDYGQDADSVYLREKAIIISSLQRAHHFIIGRHLKEVQEHISIRKIGTFQRWCRMECHISEDSALRYIRGYEFAVSRFESIEDAMEIQKSLLFMAAKISVPEAVKTAVAEKRITTMKDFNQQMKVLSSKTESVKPTVTAIPPSHVSPHQSQPISRQTNSAPMPEPITEAKIIDCLKTISMTPDSTLLRMASKFGTELDNLRRSEMVNIVDTAKRKISRLLCAI